MADDVELLVGRNLHPNCVSYFRLDVTPQTARHVMYIGRLPRGSIISSITVYVHTAFAGAKLKFGTDDEVSDMSEVDIGTVGNKVLTIPAGKELVDQVSEVSLYAKTTQNVDAGQCSIVVQFVTDRQV